MIKKDLVKAVSNKTGFTMENSEQAVTAAIDAIAECLMNFEPVTLRGLGNFIPIVRKERTAYLPMSKNPINVPERKSYRFKISDTVKARLNR